MGRLALVFLAVASLAITSVQEGSIKYSHRFRTERRNTNREELAITNVSTCDHFELGRGVSKWKSVSVREKNYAVGITDAGVSVLTIEKRNGSIATREKVVDLQGAPMDVELFKYASERNYEVLLVAAVIRAGNYELEWFKVHENGSLENTWTWHLHRKVVSLNVFRMESSWNLLVVSDDDAEDSARADLYQFVLVEGRRDFWLVQTITLDHPSKQTAVNFHGPHYFISFPRRDAVDLYKRTGERFEFHQTLEGGNFATSFRIGHKSYLAINGRNAGIYRFAADGPVKEDIRNANPDDPIDLILAVPITTYRDEVVILAQKSPDHGTHKSLAIEAIVSNGGEFALHDEMPCAYFGEDLHGISCLVGEGRSSGLDGSTGLPLGGSTLGILLPNHNPESSSGLFVLETQMKLMPSPSEIQLEKWTSTKEKLQKMIEDNDAALGRIEKRVGNSVKLNEPNVISAPWKVETLSAVVLRKPKSSDEGDFAERVDAIRTNLAKMKDALERSAPNGRPARFGNLVVDGFVQVQGKSKIEKVRADYFNEQSAPGVFSDFVRRDHVDVVIGGQKNFTNLVVEDVVFDAVNGVDSDRLVYRDGSEINIVNGDLVFEETLSVLGDVHVTTGKVNDVNLVDEVVEIGKPFGGELKFEDVKVLGGLEIDTLNEFPIRTSASVDHQTSADAMEFATLYLPENITIENLNGEDFNGFLRGICMRNLKNYVGGDVVFEDLTIPGGLEINYLNDLKFPGDYVFSTSEAFTRIEGTKFFVNSLAAGEVTTDGLINGLDTTKLVTLSEDQDLPGKFSFADLEVTEHFDVKQVQSSSFARDRTLLETNVVSSNVNFNSLEVDGTVSTGASFNGSDFQAILDDVVFKNQDSPVVIDSVKEFPRGLTVRRNAAVASNAINHTPLEQFVSKDAAQILSVGVLNGNVTFENLKLSGVFGNIDVIQLDREVVRLSGEQYVSARLVFEDEILAAELRVDGTLNGLTPDEYVFTTGDRELSLLGNLGKVKADRVGVEGNIVGAIGNFDLADFDSRRFSLTKDQVVTGDFSAQNATIRALNAQKINGYHYDDLFGPAKYTNALTGMLFDNKLKIKDLSVSGSMDIVSINNVKMADIMLSCAYVGDKLQPNVSFQNDVVFSTVRTRRLNGVEFDEFLANLVFVNETDLRIDVPKIYAGGFVVGNYVDVASLNGIPVADVLRKSGRQEVQGPLTILGNVSVESDGEISGRLNDVDVKQLAGAFEIVDGAYKINGDVYFERTAYVDNFFFDGLVGGENLTDVLNHLVSTRDDVVIPGTTVFLNSVDVKGNLAVADDIDGVDLSRFKDDVVLTTQDAYVNGLVTFSQPVEIAEEIRLESDLLGRFVMGIDLQTWKDDAVYVNGAPISGWCAS